MNSQATAHCLDAYEGTNIIVDSKEITDWVVSAGVGEHWIGADKVPSIFSSGGDFVVLFLTILLQGQCGFFLARWDAMGLYKLEWTT